MKNEHYDVIVIGAGNGGLASALTLQQNGKRVAIFEKHNIPGGCGTTFRRGRFEFEVALHQLSSMGTEENPGVLRELFKTYGIESEIDWIKIDALYKVQLPDGSGVALPTNRADAEALLAKTFPSEAENVKRYYDMVYKFADEINAFKAMQANSGPEEPGALKKFLIKKVFPKKFKTLSHYAAMPTQKVLDEFFDTPEIKLVLSAYWCFMGMPPKRFPFSILALCTYIYMEDKPFYLRGGSQVMSMALAEKIKEFGGDVYLNTRIDQIIVEDFVAKGVVDQFGNTYTADKIISNISPFDTYAELIERKYITDECIDYFKSYTVGISALVLYMGLDCEPHEVGFTDSFNLIYDSLEANEDFKMSKTLDTTRDPIVATCYTIDDPTVSPKGTSIVTAGVLKYADEWEKLSPEEYYRTKNELASTLIDRLEKRFPNLRSHIEEIEVATPLTFERYLGHPGGAIYGFEQDLKSSVFFNPTDTFIKNLDFSSGWVNTCGFGPNYLYGDKVAHEMIGGKR